MRGQIDWLQWKCNVPVAGQHAWQVQADCVGISAEAARGGTTGLEAAEKEDVPKVGQAKCCDIFGVHVSCERALSVLTMMQDQMSQLVA